jgi:hypothetical protein
VVLTTSTDVPFVCPIAKIVDAVRFIRYILSLAHAFSKCDIEQKKKRQIKELSGMSMSSFLYVPTHRRLLFSTRLVAYCVLAQADN